MRTGHILVLEEQRFSMLGLIIDLDCGDMRSSPAQDDLFQGYNSYCMLIVSTALHWFGRREG